MPHICVEAVYNRTEMTISQRHIFLSCLFYFLLWKDTARLDASVRGSRGRIQGLSLGAGQI